MSEIGIPLSIDDDAGCVVVLTGNMPEGYTREELEKMLAKGVFMDGKALKVLWDMGLCEHCGAPIKKTYDNGALEQFTDDPFNGKYRGERRDARQSFWREFGYVLKLVDNKVHVLSELISYMGENLGPTFTLYENSLG